MESIPIELIKDKKIYFASDLHLGISATKNIEEIFVKWLYSIETDCQHLFLCGDVFDFWFEYKYTAPKGYVRLLGKLAQMADNGIKIYYFTGNHDMWMYSYLQQEIGLEIFKETQRFIIDNKVFEIGHGDGLGPGDKKYKFLKKIFKCSTNQWLFARLHPNLSFGIANFFSRKSRIANSVEAEKYLGDNNEFLVQYIKNTPKENRADVYVFGHRHLPIDMKIDNSQYINIGEWTFYKSFGEYDGEMNLKYFNPDCVF